MERENVIQKDLELRNLPELFSGGDRQKWGQQRGKILDVLENEVYGKTPEFTGKVYSFVESRMESGFGGTAIKEWIRLSFETPAGMYSFPFQLIFPKTEGKKPVFVHLAFQQKTLSALNSDELNEYMPLEEILDNGYIVANLFYENVTSDTPERNGLACAYPETEGSWGKIGMWAFAASRVVDYLLTRPEVDPKRIAVTGWSRLGKTALWCGAQDERFSVVISTESGCGGAAIHRGKEGEKISDITQRFPYWFCKKYQSFCGHESDASFDQHFLLACVAPRTLLIGSAQEDQWADPKSEFLSVISASSVYQKLGKRGIEFPERYPQAGQRYLDGDVGYWIRKGGHGVIREDWIVQMNYRVIHGV
mgnify:CR=1 FL=1